MPDPALCDAAALAAFVPNVVVTHPLGPRDKPAMDHLARFAAQP